MFTLVTVGGGTAGSVLASRLAEVGDWKILLLEAGGEQSSKGKIPLFFQFFFVKSQQGEFVFLGQSTMVSSLVDGLSS